ncbi:MAG TPA: PLP-dependent aminotransferase family protein [Anaerolineaceae bacterium]|jgi:2-aminoadipate transaminase|nr:PLP-dependent aminotransferase family protein [Anaerolineales bacterium]HOG58939.1 PLP-dependent aminotransferase family protein [Anaerolineaceae bacterium]HOR83477.1 PLP-dependent aminotransferase family protein [Anaerolineaceae bacterium]HPL42819.1 PLP-dependent aminotransferase family protein [Anaerolineaceae bacterium]HPY33377.1 PLP-dependent aminotransferase family protein [Anaerolineaceae bacterium]
MHTSWDHRYAHRTAGMTSSFIRELLKVTAQPDIISFGGGFPAAELFPLDRVKEACDKVLTENGAKALQYSQTEGYAPLRGLIAANVSRYGINVSADNVLITTGSQQALDIIGRIFINRGDRVLTESPTYLGALQAWNAYGAAYETVISDNDGLSTDDLAKVIGSHIKFMYVLPNFQNPAGVTLTLERRQKLVELADRFCVPIVEDDPYGQLRFEGEHLPPVVVLDDALRDNGILSYRGNVIYTSTVSKILAPGLRIGWVIAPTEVIKKMVQAKQGADLQCSTFDQYVAYELLQGDWMKDHIQTLRKVYKERRDAMLQAFEDFMPEGTTWTRPQGGLFLWLRLPEGCNATELFPIAVEEKVAYVPGEPFYPNGGPLNTMRLNFSACNPETIRVGVERLARMVRRCI